MDRATDSTVATTRGVPGPVDPAQLSPTQPVDRLEVFPRAGAVTHWPSSIAVVLSSSLPPGPLIGRDPLSIEPGATPSRPELRLPWGLR